MIHGDSGSLWQVTTLPRKPLAITLNSSSRINYAKWKHPAAYNRIQFVWRAVLQIKSNIQSSHPSSWPAFLIVWLFVGVWFFVFLWVCISRFPKHRLYFGRSGQKSARSHAASKLVDCVALTNYSLLVFTSLLQSQFGELNGNKSWHATPGC